MNIYEDIIGEITVLEWRMKDLENEYHFWYRNCFSAGRTPAAPLNVCLERMQAICDKMEAFATLLEQKKALREQIKAIAHQYEGIQGKIVYMRLIENKTLKEISHELHLSYGYVRNLASSKKKAPAS